MEISKLTQFAFGGGGDAKAASAATERGFAGAMDKTRPVRPPGVDPPPEAKTGEEVAQEPNAQAQRPDLLPKDTDPTPDPTTVMDAMQALLAEVAPGTFQSPVPMPTPAVTVASAPAPAAVDREVASPVPPGALTRSDAPVAPFALSSGAANAAVKKGSVDPLPMPPVFGKEPPPVEPGGDPVKKGTEPSPLPPVGQTPAGREPQAMPPVLVDGKPLPSPMPPVSGETKPAPAPMPPVGKPAAKLVGPPIDGTQIPQTDDAAITAVSVAADVVAPPVAVAGERSGFVKVAGNGFPFAPPPEPAIAIPAIPEQPLKDAPNAPAPGAPNAPAPGAPIASEPSEGETPPGGTPRTPDMPLRMADPPVSAPVKSNNPEPGSGTVNAGPTPVKANPSQPTPNQPDEGNAGGGEAETPPQMEVPVKGTNPEPETPAIANHAKTTAVEPKAAPEVSMKIETRPTERVVDIQLPNGERVSNDKVVRQVAERMEFLAATRPRGGITVQLEPAGLGSITMTVRSLGKEIDAQLMASNDGVRQALDNSRPQLAQQLEVRGFQLNQLTVGAASATSASVGDQSHRAPQNPMPQSNSSSFSGRGDGNDTYRGPAAPTPTPYGASRAAGVDLWI